MIAPIGRVQGLQEAAALHPHPPAAAACPQSTAGSLGEDQGRDSKANHRPGLLPGRNRGHPDQEHPPQPSQTRPDQHQDCDHSHNS